MSQIDVHTGMRVELLGASAAAAKVPKPWWKRYILDGLF
jgi:hypothetical protein